MPDVTYEDGEPVLDDAIMTWASEHRPCMDWLFVGDPSNLLRRFSQSMRFERDMLEINLQLEPEVRAGMLAWLRAVVVHGIPMEEAEPLFAQVVKEFRERAA